MKNTIILLLSTLFLTGCALNLVTGRKQLNLVPESELQLMATSQYSAFLAEHKVLSPGTKDAAMVDRVGARISNAITEYYNSKGQ